MKTTNHKTITNTAINIANQSGIQTTNQSKFQHNLKTNTKAKHKQTQQLNKLQTRKQQPAISTTKLPLNTSKQPKPH